MTVRGLVLPAALALGVVAGSGTTSWAQRAAGARAGGPPPAPLVLKGKSSFRGPQPADAAKAAIADGQRASRAVQVKVFDGFEMKTVPVEADGDFSLPIPQAADGTLLAVYATRVAAVPQLRQVQVKRAGAGAAAEVLEVPEMPLAPLARANVGTLVGHAYVRTEGGRANRRRGIVRFDANLPLKIEAPGRPSVEVRTGADGSFRVELPPGSYTITTARNVVQKVVVRLGQTTVAPVYSGQITY